MSDCIGCKDDSAKCVRDNCSRCCTCGRFRASDPRPPYPPLSTLGAWRVYFNHHAAAPRVWCIAPLTDGFEFAVRSVVILTRVDTVYAPKPTPDHEDGKPSAWLVARGRLTVDVDGNATIGDE